eukprot:1194255-Prorocentrum_minimum.AAC.1
MAAWQGACRGGWDGAVPEVVRARQARHTQEGPGHPRARSGGGGGGGGLRWRGPGGGTGGGDTPPNATQNVTQRDTTRPNVTKRDQTRPNVTKRDPT